MVVSLTNISPAHAAHYYTGHDSSASTWQGKTAQALGLQGVVETAAFESLLYGRDPDGTVLLAKVRLHTRQSQQQAQGQTPETERAGLDLTASAPKSVSLQALVFGDTRLEAAHQAANAVMLQVLEDRYAMTRIRADGKRVKVNTGALAIASFHHDTSRALDPQLHTHNVVLNLQRHPQTGRWQSLDNTAIFKAKILLGQIYRNELACAVQDLGYRLRLTGQPHGLWELEGFAPGQLKVFSTRSQQIAAVAGADATPQSRLRAVQLTRPEKQDLPRADLLASWQVQAQAAQILPLSTEVLSVSTGDGQTITQALAALNPATWPREEGERLLLQTPGQAPFAIIQQALDQTFQTRPQLLTVNQGANDDLRRIDHQGTAKQNPHVTTTDPTGTATWHPASRTATQSTSDVDGAAAHTHASEFARATTGSNTANDRANALNQSNATTKAGALDGATTHPTDAALGRYGAASTSDSQTHRAANRATGETDVADSSAVAHQPDYTQAIGGGDDQTRRYPDAFVKLAAEFRRLATVFGTAAPTASNALGHGEVGFAERATPTDQSDGTGNESPTEDTAAVHSQRSIFNARPQDTATTLADDPGWEDELELG